MNPEREREREREREKERDRERKRETERKRERERERWPVVASFKCPATHIVQFPLIKVGCHICQTLEHLALAA
jgi:hypothetical protein